jgi:hypothetical protein
MRMVIPPPRSVHRHGPKMYSWSVRPDKERIRFIGHQMTAAMVTPIRWTVYVVGLLLVAPASMPAQDALTPPIEAAARYMLEMEGVSDHSQLVVDIGQFGIRPASLSADLSAEMRQAAAELAASLGTGTGRLETLMACPQEPPAPEVFRRRGHHSCKLVDGVRMVLQVNEPEQVEDGLIIPVALWFFVDDRAGDQSWMHAVSRQLKLTQKSTGEWRIVGHGITTRGRF